MHTVYCHTHTEVHEYLNDVLLNAYLRGWNKVHSVWNGTQSMMKHKNHKVCWSHLEPSHLKRFCAPTSSVASQMAILPKFNETASYDLSQASFQDMPLHWVHGPCLPREDFGTSPRELLTVWWKGEKKGHPVTHSPWKLADLKATINAYKEYKVHMRSWVMNTS